MISYTMCESDVTNLVQRVMKTQHQELFREKLKVDAVFAVEDGGGPGIMLHGYPCAATIRKVSYKQRVLGRGDAELTLDQAIWLDLTDRQKEALIDHELTHLLLVMDAKHNVVKTDRAGRPKLALRLHDWELGGFEDTARRYGKDAPEVIEARKFAQKFGQICFDFMKPGKEAA